jgi:hypothetical protein
MRVADTAAAGKQAADTWAGVPVRVQVPEQELLQVQLQRERMREQVPAVRQVLHLQRVIRS